MVLIHAIKLLICLRGMKKSIPHPDEMEPHCFTNLVILLYLFVVELVIANRPIQKVGVVNFIFKTYLLLDHLYGLEVLEVWISVVRVSKIEVFEEDIGWLLVGQTLSGRLFLFKFRQFKIELFERFNLLLELLWCTLLALLFDNRSSGLIDLNFLRTYYRMIIWTLGVARISLNHL